MWEGTLGVYFTAISWEKQKWNITNHFNKVVKQEGEIINIFQKYDDVKRITSQCEVSLIDVYLAVQQAARGGVGNLKIPSKNYVEY